VSRPGGKTRVVRHVREFLADTVTPLALYRRFSRRERGAFLFESVTGGEHVSRFSLLGCAPSVVLRLFPDRLEIEQAGRVEVERQQPFIALRAWLEAYQAAPATAAPLAFDGGWVGTLGYDTVRFLERLERAQLSPAMPGEIPVAIFARFDSVLVFDHARHRVLAVANEIEGEVSRQAADESLRDLAALLTGEVAEGAIELLGSAQAPAVLSLDDEAEVSMSGEQFQRVVLAAKEHIAAGDIFQVVLARRWKIKAPAADTLALYRALRWINPSPYMVLLEFPEVALIGASPEMLVRVEGRTVETRPIAGTRRRGKDEQEDARLAAELLADAKERAEHVMLVDLGRNDLGRVCCPGSVRVRDFLQIEKYSHVMHIVSSVVGELSPAQTPFDALLAAFPAGTVSGAPKIRAMQLIDTLEAESRGPYAGAVGYLSFSGNLDACITIRTLVWAAGELSVSAGAGIVADSDPAAEQVETENKAGALLQAARLARALA